MSADWSTERLWIVVPCMGRRSFLEQTVPTVLAQPGVRYCLVDYSCPDGAADWLEAVYPGEVRQGLAAVVRIPGERYFNKCRALNAGARHAIHAGARYICFLDADTLLAPGFSPWVLERLREDRFLVAARRADGRHARCTGGLLVVPARQLEVSGGFDEAFRGWGCEDLEMRLRLLLVRGLSYESIPLELLRPIPHPDELRGRYYEERSLRASNRRNLARLGHKVKQWTGERPEKLGREAVRLLVRGPASLSFGLPARTRQGWR